MRCDLIVNRTINAGDYPVMEIGASFTEDSTLLGMIPNGIIELNNTGENARIIYKEIYRNEQTKYAYKDIAIMEYEFPLIIRTLNANIIKYKRSFLDPVSQRTMQLSLHPFLSDLFTSDAYYASEDMYNSMLEKIVYYDTIRAFKLFTDSVKHIVETNYMINHPELGTVVPNSIGSAEFDRGAIRNESATFTDLCTNRILGK